MSDASGTTGLTLPGMIDEPGCRSGMCSSPRPVFGPGAHPAQVVADLGERDGDRAQRAGCLDEAVAVGLRLEVVLRLGDRQLGVGDEELDDLLREARAGVLMPVPTAVPPSGTSATRGSTDCTRSMPRRIWRA